MWDVLLGINWIRVLDTVSSYYYITLPLLLLLLVWLILRRRAKTKAEESAKDEAPPPKRVEVAEETTSRFNRRMGPNFRAGLRRMGQFFPGQQGRYGQPWFVATGLRANGQSDLFRLSGPTTPNADAGGATIGEEPCRWWFFEGGVILDIDGEILNFDEPGDDRDWLEFCRLLTDARKRRPLDGVLVSIPASELIAYNGSNASTLERNAEVLYRRLVSLQKSTGMVFPVYFQITQCESIPGFSDFCSEIPEHFRDQMFGWSSPYDLRQPYNGSWVQEAFSSMVLQIRRLQIEAAYDGLSKDVDDGFFRFPTEFSRLVEPLRLYLDGLFTQTSYHDPLHLRGVYLSGTILNPTERQVSQALDEPDPFLAALENLETSDYQPEDESQIPEHTSRPSFFKELLSQKVFKEYHLSKPTSGKIKESQNKSRAVKLAAALFVVFLIAGALIRYTDLNDHTWRLNNAMINMKADLGDIEENHDAIMNASESSEWDVDYEHLFEAIRLIEEEPVWSFFYPSSWSMFSTLHRDLDKAIGFGYEQIVFRALGVKLQQKKQAFLKTYAQRDPCGSGLYNIQDRLINPESSDPADQVPEAQDVDVFLYADYTELKSYREMGDWLNHLGVLFKSIRVNNGMNSDVNIEDFNSLVRYAFDRPNYRATFKPGEYYLDADKSPVRLTPQDIDWAHNGIEQQFKIFLRELFNTDIFLLKAQNTVLSGINNQYEMLGDPEQAVERLARLAQVLEQIERAIPVAFTMDRTPIEAADFAFFEDQFIAMESQIDKGLENEMYGCYRAHHSELANLLDLEFLQGAVAFHQPIRAFLNLLIVQKRANESDVPRDNFNAWKKQDLDYSINLYQNYKNFRERTLENLPEGYWRPLLEQLAVDLFDLRVKNVSLRAPVSDKSDRSDITAFLNAMPTIHKLDTILRELNLYDTADELIQTVENTAFNLLKGNDDALINSSFFLVNGRWGGWDGKRDIPSSAFRLRDPQALAYHFDDQLAGLRQMSEDASRLVTILGIQFIAENRQPIDEPEAAPPARLDDGQKYQSEVLCLNDSPFYTDPESIINRWLGIMQDLEDYDSQRPYPALRELERFYLDVMPRIRLENYREVIGEIQPASSYFSDTLYRLKCEILRKCEQLEEELWLYTVLDKQEEFVGVEGSSNGVISYFNNHLRGRFPFAPMGLDDVPSVEVAHIREFYRRFAQQAPVLKEVLSSLEGRGHNITDTERDILDFMRQMEICGEFLQTLVNPSTDKTIPVWNIKTRLRVLPQFEIYGNHFIERRLALGDEETIISEGAGTWRYGEPVEISFLWARSVPVTTGLPDCEPAADRVRTCFRYDDPWALLRFIRTHLESFEDSKHVLRFEIPVVAKDGESIPESGDTAVILTLFELFDKEGKPLVVPQFPSESPNSLNEILPHGGKP